MLQGEKLTGPIYEGEFKIVKYIDKKNVESEEMIHTSYPFLHFVVLRVSLR